MSMAAFEDRFIATVDDEEFDIKLRKSEGKFRLEYNGALYSVMIDRLSDKKILLKIDNNSVEADIVRNGRDLSVFLEGKDMVVKVEPYNLAELRRRAGVALGGVEDKIVRAPMPGSVLAVSVNTGERVNKGATLAIIEAMKMENLIRASHAGIVKEVFVAAGKAVEKNEKLMEFE
jgi:biotin carboxyl carrier protein